MTRTRAPVRPKDEPIVFIRIAWMKKYRGESKDDVVNPGNFSYLLSGRKQGKKAPAHEQWNFSEKNGRVYAYVPMDSRVNIRRLGAKPAQQTLEGVLVVFVARDPLSNTLKIVGWYRDATVSRMWSEHKHGKLKVQTSIDSRAENAHLVSVADRVGPEIPVASAQSAGGFGKSAIWYGDKWPKLVKEVRERISRTRLNRAGRVEPDRTLHHGWPKKRDIDRCREVEVRAMQLAMSYFDNPEDVSKECLGWDIEASADENEVLIEVKGLFGDQLQVELTPNEYKQMQGNKERYLLFVVTSALSESPEVRVFRFQSDSPRGAGWVSNRGEVLRIAERTGAHCALSGADV